MIDMMIAAVDIRTYSRGAQQDRVSSLQKQNRMAYVELFIAQY
jgi:hypothetical protein